MVTRSGRKRVRRQVEEDEDEDECWTPKRRSSAVERYRYCEVEPEQMRRSLRLMRKAARASLIAEPIMIIDLTDEAEEENEVDAKYSTTQTQSELLRRFEEQCAQIRRKGISERPEATYLEELNEDEREITKELTMRTSGNTKLTSIENPTGGKITLQGRDFKLLRGSRWLNDELINGYMGLINLRNREIFDQLPNKATKDIPQTFAFSTFFFTCLTRCGYEYSRVARWTRRAEVKVLEYDLLLVPVNLGNTHWVLSAVDVSRKCFLYLDSMRGNDYSGVINALRRWFVDEVGDKYGQERVEKLEMDKWGVFCNEYVIKRVGVLPKCLEAHGGMKNRRASVPWQKDNGSCGVFTAKAADCLSLGIKMYLKQRDVSLVRSRMALELFSGFLAC